MQLIVLLFGGDVYICFPCLAELSKEAEVKVSYTEWNLGTN